MKKASWKNYILFILIAEAVGALDGFLIRAGVQDYSANIAKPPLSPPDLVFPIVWGILFLLLGIGAARIWDSSPEHRDAIAVWALQLAVNFVWPLLFFNAQAFGFSLFWLLILWALIFWMILEFRKADKLSAILQAPYLLWVIFAIYLNAGVWLLNR